MTNLRYADDVVAMAITRRKLQSLMTRLQDASDQMGLTINVSKTEILTIPHVDASEFVIYGESVPQSDRFKYLGAMYGSDTAGVSDFRERLGKGYARLGELNSILQLKDLSVHLKVKVIKSMVFSVVTYGCEAWNLTKDERTKLAAFEMKAYRRILGISYLDRVKNSDVVTRVNAQPMLLAQ